VRVVVKIGSSSIVGEDGEVRSQVLDNLGSQLSKILRDGHEVALVTSGAIALGRALLTEKLVPFSGRIGSDLPTLQAISGVGQSRLMHYWDGTLQGHGLIGAQILLAPLDFMNRQQYLHARATLARLFSLRIIPVINENDAIADEEIRFGDNDRLAALVAHLVSADLLVLLTDTPGLMTTDPHIRHDASLIEEVVEVDRQLEELAGGTVSQIGSGGMASKLAAAKMASWSGTKVVIAASWRAHILEEAVEGENVVGTVIHAKPHRLSARKLWIAFAVGSKGVVVVDEGARKAVIEKGTSLLPAGVLGVKGDFDANDPVEVANEQGEVFAKGLVRYSSGMVELWAGKHSSIIPNELGEEVIHRDDLVLLV